MQSSKFLRPDSAIQYYNNLNWNSLVVLCFTHLWSRRWNLKVTGVWVYSGQSSKSTIFLLLSNFLINCFLLYLIFCLSVLSFKSILKHSYFRLINRIILLIVFLFYHFNFRRAYTSHFVIFVCINIIEVLYFDFPVFIALLCIKMLKFVCSQYYLKFVCA